MSVYLFDHQNEEWKVCAFVFLNHSWEKDYVENREDFEQQLDKIQMHSVYNANTCKYLTFMLENGLKQLI